MIADDTIQVALAFYDPCHDYARYAGVVVTSIFSHTKSRVHVTIVHDSTLTDENRRRFEQTAQRWEQSVSFVDVGAQALQIFADPEERWPIYGRGALYRLLIPSLLNVPWVIYLDCDILVNLDIAELWAASKLEEAQNAFLIASRSASGGTKYNWLIRWHSKIRGWGMPSVLHDRKRLFNSGVLLMNLSRIREKYDLKKEAARFFERYIHFADQADNEFLCFLFSGDGDVFWTDARFNRCGDFVNLDNAILHMARAQPWKVFRDTPRDDLFWKTLAESEWRDDLLEMLRKRPIETYRASEGIRLLFSRAAVYKKRFIAMLKALFHIAVYRGK
jgi:lipopolysaccharide biosynthesis glycosyltransferase